MMLKSKQFMLGLVMAALVGASSASVIAQTPETLTKPDAALKLEGGTKTRQRLANKTPEPARVEPTDVVVGPDDSTKSVTSKDVKPAAPEATPEPVVVGDDVVVAPTPKSSPEAAEKPPTETAAIDPNRHELPTEEADIVNSYNNFFNTYRLGPEDVISVSVFGQDRYSRAGIVIPPSGRISLALIPAGVFVNGKTVEEVAELIKKRYDEYIIDPQVDVALDKASSYRYSVIGDVAQPGIRLMNRRLTVAEALGEAGGVLPTGDRSKVMVLRKQANGILSPIAVNVSAIYKGKAPDTTYLVPGDQVIVPGNKLKSFQKIMNFIPILSFARIFTGGVF
jgi:polysaccharide biosynthesis/export protein